MGNNYSKYKKDQDYLLEVKTITVDLNSNNSGDYVELLVGDRPCGYLKQESEGIGECEDEKDIMIF